MQNQASASSHQPSVRGARYFSQTWRAARRWCVYVCVAAAFGTLAQLLLWGLGQPAVTAAVVTPSGTWPALAAGGIAHDARSLFDYRVSQGLDWLAGRSIASLSLFNTITVNDASDTAANDGKCTLREAIIAASTNNQSGTLLGECAAGGTGADTINFNIAPGGAVTIAVLSALPSITGSVTIDGTAQPGYSNSPIIELNGASAGANANGLVVNANNTTVRGLVINRFSGNGIYVSYFLSNVLIEGNYIGTDIAGNLDLGNTGAGILLDSPATVGGTAVTSRNVISGNNGNGISINGSFGGGGSIVQGNYIGLNAAGLSDLGNSATGISIFNFSANNIIGGTATGAGNVISGNDVDGMCICTSGTTNTTIQGNRIGTDATGTASVGNTRNGIAAISSGIIIGGTSAGAGNVISGNGNDGIGDPPSNVVGGHGALTIQGNYIGTDITGTVRVGNTGNGIRISGGQGSVISGNVISSNGGHGLNLESNTSIGPSVQGNYIGTNVAGASTLGNTGNGIRVVQSNVSIGGTSANIIAYNSQNGIELTNGVSGTSIKGNQVKQNTLNGVQATQTNGLTTLGSEGIGEGNTITSNGENGVQVRTNASRVKIRGNTISDNTKLAIDLAPTLPGGTVTPNDSTDSDSGPNLLQNFPVLDPLSQPCNITGTLPGGVLSSTVTLDFYANTTCDAASNGEGAVYLGSMPLILTSANTPFSFAIPSPALLTGNHIITVTATDADGNTSEFSACRLLQLPMITTHPASQTVCATNNVRLSVVATDAVSYQWRKNNSDLDGETNATLSLNNVTTTDAGNYTVVVTGLCQTSTTSSIATLAVNAPPSVTTQPQNQSTQAGTTVMFTAAATGTPVPTVRWQVAPPGLNFSDISGAMSTTLNVSNVTLAMNGYRYRAVFSNQCNAEVSSDTATLSVTSIEPQTIIVNTTADEDTHPAGGTGCSLREAITAANTNAVYGGCVAGTAGADTIEFALGSGTPMMNISGYLPAVFETLTINGATGGASFIVLDGTNSALFESALSIAASNCVIRNLVIKRFDGPGINLSGPGGNLVENCRIGTDALGLNDEGNRFTGIYITSPNNTIRGNLISGNQVSGISVDGGTGNLIAGNSIGTNLAGTAAIPNGFNSTGYGISLGFGGGATIGGTTLADSNVISGNSGPGIYLDGLSGPGGTSATILGNYIGITKDGAEPLGNDGNGIMLYVASNIVIGGAAAGSGNVISANAGSGITLAGSQADNNLIRGNLIGRNAANTANLGNSSQGINIINGSNNSIGGLDAGMGNVIAGNANGVLIGETASARQNTISGNAIFENTQLGIELTSLLSFGVTPNDTGDGDIGANNVQNFPVLTSVTSGGLVTGTFNSTPNRTFRIEYFKNRGCDPNGNGEGETFLDYQEVTTDGSGDALLSFSFATDIAKPFVTATATDLTTGDTSEFSACVRFCPALTVISSPTTLPGTATVGTAYPTVTFNGSGGTSPYSFSYSGTLPTGLSLVGATLAGTPNTTGTYNFTVQVTDASGCMGTQAYSIVVSCPTYTITPSTLPNGTLNVGYDEQLMVSGGASGPYQFGFVSGLPSGLFITTTGRLFGTPTEAGTFNLSVPVFETISCITSQPYTLTINPPVCPTISVFPTPPLAFGLVGTAYTSTFISVSASPTATYSFTVSAGMLPPELELIQVSGSWRISHRSGMPLLATPGKYDFTLRATNTATGCSGTRDYTIVVHTSSPTIIVNTDVDENGTGPNCSLREAIIAANNNAPFGGCSAGVSGYDTIGFAAAYSIALTGGLPGPSEPLFINGLVGAARVELNGAGASASQALLLESGYHYLKSLVINRLANGNAINIVGTNAISNAIEDCRLGTNVIGTAAMPNGGGIGVFNAGPRNRIGSVTMPNLISGNISTGVNIVDAPGTAVTGNLIGLQAGGLAPLGNGGDGVRVRNTTAPSGTIFVTGVSSNKIAYNASGINIADTALGQRTNLSSNSVFNNTGLGIDLGNDGVTPNDAGDADTGTNRLLNFPVLNSITATSTGGTVNATLDIATGNAGFNASVQFFASSSCDPSGFGEGESLLGSVTGITAAAASGFTFSYTAGQVFGKPYITAVAIDAQGNTSEFSQCRAVPNDLPEIIASTPISSLQGAMANGQVIAIAGDINQAANTLIVTATPLTGSGVTLSNISVDAAGQVTANVSATCAATPSTFTLTVRDQQNATATTTLTVSVTPATPASATPFSSTSVTEGQSASFTTTVSGTAPFTFVWKKGANVLNSGGKFSIISTTTTSTLTITGAQLGDTGTYSVEVAGICGPTAVQSATLTVNPANTPPTLSGATLNVRQGNAIAALQIGAASDLQQAPNTLTFHISNGGVLNGVHVNFTQIQATGEVMANVFADCDATNATFTIGVSDAQNALTSVPLTINVLPNQPPGLSYNSATVLVGSSNSLNPASGPSDVSYTLGLQSVTPNTFTGTFNVLSSGVVQVNNAGPLGTYQVVIRATDNCGLHTDAAFTLTVVNTTGGPTVTPSLPPGSPHVTFSNVVTPGNTTVTPIPPNDAGALPSGFSLPGLNVAFEIATTAVFNGPVVLTFDVPAAVDPAVFDKLRVLHNEGGVLVDRTILPPNQPAPHFQTRKISALVSSFSPFVIAGVISTPTVTVAVAPASTTVGQAASFTATVLSSSLPVLQGSLTFKEGATVLAGPIVLDASGQAGFNTSALTLGTHTITAEYSGAGLFNPANGNTQHSVGCPTISLANLPAATAGAAYSQTLNGTPAGGNYSFTLTGGALPPGLNLNNGVLSGTPTQAGSFSFTLTATGFGTCTQARSYSFTVNCPTVSVSPNSLPNGVAGSVYSPRSLSAAPVGTTYGYAVTQGQLPPGLTLNNGVISGTPIAPGNFSFTITATGFGACTGARTFTILVTGTCNPITVQPASLAGGTTGVTYYQKLSATGGAEPYTYSVSTGVLPAGLTLNSASGEITGAPLQGGVVAFTIRATSAGGCNSTRSYVMSIACGTLNWSPEALPPGRVREAYSQQFSVNPASNATFSLLLGSLPAGLSLSSSGLISGITNNSGTFNFTVKAVAGPCQSTKAYTLVLNNQQAVRNDYDGDGKSDLVSWNEKDGRWLIVNSHDGALQNFVFGAPGDISAPGDYDGDGRWDAAVFRPGDGVWYVRLSGTGQHQTKLWGIAGDTPVPGDYDGDGKTDFAVWRGAEGRWYIWRSSDGASQNEAWGTANSPYQDVPVPGDYDGDGKSDFAVFRRGSGTWLIKHSGAGTTQAQAWGLGTDTPVAADYDGDGRTDIAVWRGSEGVWYVLRSADNATLVKAWGSQLPPYFDTPAPGDYDGDGQADLTVCRQGKTWYIVKSSDGATATRQLP